MPTSGWDKFTFRDMYEGDPELAALIAGNEGDEEQWDEGEDSEVDDGGIILHPPTEE